MWRRSSSHAKTWTEKNAALSSSSKDIRMGENLVLFIKGTDLLDQNLD